MFSKLPPLVRVPVRYGLIAGAIGFILLVSLFYMDKHPQLVFPFFDFRIAIFSVFGVFVMRELRDYYFDNFLTFWQGMISSFIFTLVFALIASLLLLLFTYMETDYVSVFIKQSIEQIKSAPVEDIKRIGKEAYDELLKSTSLVDGVFLAKRYFFQSFFISFLISIIISVILRRQPKPV